MHKANGTPFGISEQHMVIKSDPPVKATNYYFPRMIPSELIRESVEILVDHYGSKNLPVDATIEWGTSKQPTKLYPTPPPLLKRLLREMESNISTTDSMAEKH